MSLQSIRDDYMLFNSSLCWFVFVLNPVEVRVHCKKIFLGSTYTFTKAKNKEVSFFFEVVSYNKSTFIIFPDAYRGF